MHWKKKLTGLNLIEKGLCYLRKIIKNLQLI